MHKISLAYFLVECLKLKFRSIDRKAKILDFNEKTVMAFVEEQMFLCSRKKLGHIYRKLKHKAMHILRN